jgi:hypothetical protein
MIALGKRRIERDPLGSARARPPGALRPALPEASRDRHARPIVTFA